MAHFDKVLRAIQNREVSVNTKTKYLNDDSIYCHFFLNTHFQFMPFDKKLFKYLGILK